MGINKWQKKPLKSLCTRIGDGLHGTPTYDENSEFYSTQSKYTFIIY